MSLNRSEFAGDTMLMQANTRRVDHLNIAAEGRTNRLGDLSHQPAASGQSDYNRGCTGQTHFGLATELDHKSLKLLNSFRAAR
ncbi:hypothetical protein [Martelella endophytica]|uniref:hypothetical protein n=1 Tax=Martelella endophytica TaxID=1486262 RepID=UPI0011861A15